MPPRLCRCGRFVSHAVDTDRKAEVLAGMKADGYIAPDVDYVGWFPETQRPRFMPRPTGP